MFFCWSSPLKSGINRELASSVHSAHFFWQREGQVRSFKMFYKPLTVSPHSWTMLHCLLAQAVSGQAFKKYNVHQGKAAHQALYNTTWWYAHTFRLELSCAKKIQTLGVRKWGKCKVQEIPEIGTCDITSPCAHSKKRERKLPVSGPPEQFSFKSSRSGNKTIPDVLRKRATSRLLRLFLFDACASCHSVVDINGQSQKIGICSWTPNFRFTLY